MSGIKFLEELLTEDNISERFGLKVDGIVKLKKIKEKNLEELKYVIIPDLFTIDETIAFDNPELEKAYIKYTSQFNEPKIILARSSDPNEIPGKFETAPSLYDPKHPKKSFENWINAAKKVRESGARKILGQELVGELEDFAHDYEYIKDNEGNLKEEKITIKSFGGSLTSFFMNSTNFISGDKPSIAACFGLASKIARGDKDVSIIQYSAGVRVINLNQNYESGSQAKYKQQTVDLITLDNPSKVSTIKYNHKCQPSGINNGKGSTPFIEKYYFKESEKNEYYREFDINELFNIISAIKATTDKHIELEGSINNKGIHLFQLREYELPTKVFNGLTQKDNIDKILEDNTYGLGFNQFIGDIYISKKTIDIPENATLWYNGNIYDNNINEFRKYKQLIIPFNIPTGVVYYEVHAVAQTIKTMFELEKLGVRSIAIFMDPIDNKNIAETLKKPNLKYEKDNDTIILRNMTAECNGSDIQIYYNK